MSELIGILPHNIDQRKIAELVAALKKGKIIIVPTDSIYAIAGDLNHRSVLDKISRLTDKKANKIKLSILCKDLSNLSYYTHQIDNDTYKLMNRLLPGPFTFVLKASNNVPKIFRQNKKTIGIRVPDNAIVQAIIEELGNPLVSTSIHSENEIQTYLTEIEEIYEAWGSKVDYIVDGGTGGNVGSTVIDASGDEMVLLREGKGAELL
ncbi:MAG: threonylcarbamoyl-AMP synthase [Bacteroidia bacterium]